MVVFTCTRVNEEWMENPIITIFWLERIMEERTKVRFVLLLVGPILSKQHHEERTGVISFVPRIHLI